MNKIKLFTTLSSLTISAVAVPTIATACTTVNKTNTDSNDDNSNTVSAVDISTLPWYQCALFYDNDENTIITKVKNDNLNILDSYEGIEAGCTWTATFDEDTNTITITITGNGGNYTGVVTWTAAYVAPDPEPSPTPTPVFDSRTYKELTVLRSTKSLATGRRYRLNNYEATTTQEGTIAAATQLKFDIILTAISQSAFSDDVQIDANTSSPTNINFSSWIVKYSFDNDVNKFGWADQVNGKGVIYYMKDEFCNECPYDFKNLQFKNYYNPGGQFVWDGIYRYTFSGCGSTQVAETDGSLTTRAYENTIRSYHENGKFKLNNIVVGVGAKNVYGNIFDFECHDINQWKGLAGFYNNVFGTSCYNLWINYDHHDNTYGANCHDMVFHELNWFNVYGDGCYSFSASAEIYYNTYGARCHDINPPYKFSYNTFGPGCYNFKTWYMYYSQWSFGAGCHDFTISPSRSYDGCRFGNYCYNITFAGSSSQGAYYCEFGDGCHDITINKYAHRNTFENGCSNITVGSNNERNSFGNGCNNISLGTYCCDNSFNNNVSNITTATNGYCNSNNFGNNCDNIKLCSNSKNNVFEPSCSNIRLGVTSSGSLYNKQNSADYTTGNKFRSGCSYIDVIFPSTSSGFNFKGNIFNETSGTASAHFQINSEKIGHIWNKNVDVTPALDSTNECINTWYADDKKVN